MRVGLGYDVHRLVEGRDLILGGVKIPYEKGLLGHSDADVLLHALTDALLGAAALGDIGRHFPDTDERYRGISSLILLEKAYTLVKERGYSLGNADMVLILQKPKLKEYIPSMEENIAGALSCEKERISVKATTEEGLGFTGQGEGVSAKAIVLLEKSKD
jgi:ygbB family